MKRQQENLFDDRKVVADWDTTVQKGNGTSPLKASEADPTFIYGVFFQTHPWPETAKRVGIIIRNIETGDFKVGLLSNLQNNDSLPLLAVKNTTLPEFINTLLKNIYIEVRQFEKLSTLAIKAGV